MHRTRYTYSHGEIITSRVFVRKQLIAVAGLTNGQSLQCALVKRGPVIYAALRIMWRGEQNQGRNCIG